MIPKRIILHHSFTADSQTVSWGPIRQYHKEIKGWKNIGYHAGIENVNGYYEILLGRMWNEVGAHTQGHNQDSFGLCFVGNFDESEVPPEQWNTGVKLVTSLCKLFIIPVERIYGHREFNSLKTCPGTKFNLDGFRHQVSQKILLV